jgi:hypothetical protein
VTQKKNVVQGLKGEVVDALSEEMSKRPQKSWRTHRGSPGEKVLALHSILKPEDPNINLVPYQSLILSPQGTQP